MVPFVSDALAVIVRLDPVVRLVPLAGLVIDTTGEDGGAVTVIVIGLESVDTPFVSVALAVMVNVPEVEFVQLAEYGDELAEPKSVVPL